MFPHFIETDRLILKNITKSDQSFTLSHFSDPVVTKHLYDNEPIKTLKEADDIITSYTEPKPKGQQRWVLSLKDNGVRIGTCGFHCFEEASGCIEIGYDLQQMYSGNGFMNEALTAILTYAKESDEIRIVKAHVSINNKKSIQVVQRLGFVFEGETKVYTFKGVDYQHNIYVLHL